MDQPTVTRQQIETVSALDGTPLGPWLRRAARAIPDYWAARAIESGTMRLTRLGFFRIPYEDSEPIVALVCELVRPERLDRERRRALVYLWFTDRGDFRAWSQETDAVPDEARRVGEARG